MKRAIPDRAIARQRDPVEVIDAIQRIEIGRRLILEEGSLELLEEYPCGVFQVRRGARETQFVDEVAHPIVTYADAGLDRWDALGRIVQIVRCDRREITVEIGARVGDLHTAPIQMFREVQQLKIIA